MSSTFLLELGMEEIPARFVSDAAAQLKQKTEERLKEARLSFQEIRSLSTPRRLAVLVSGLVEKQADMEEEVRGPSLKVARDENGNWTKAALGFARSQGIDPEQLVIREQKGTEYVYAVKHFSGRPTSQVLAEILPELIASLTFPVHMRWGNYDFKFIRPIRWIVAMHGDEVIPFEIAGVRSGNRTSGHRFLGAETVLANAEQYESALEKQYVIADAEERRKRIREQIEALAAQKGWQIPIDEGLLDEVVHLVEYPTVLHGHFEPEFLELPQKVLITTMREHQRYFPVQDLNGKLLPYFVTVLNSDERAVSTVARGNEKVLRARLADARFFYQEDMRLSIEEAVQKLETVVFHEKLGTIADKTRRIRAISSRLANLAGWDDEWTGLAERAAAICKFDLVTQMVYEFPELQGVMGREYALKAGEDERVAVAIDEHYSPRHAGDALPSTPLGALIGIADKMDTLAGCFSIGIVPTGSQDPYALRRQAAGVVQTLLEHELPFSLTDLIQIALDVLAEARALERERKDIEDDLRKFFAQRVKAVLDELADYDEVDAVMAAGFDDIPAAVRRTNALKRFVAADENKAVLESFTRVANLAEKAESTLIRPELFEAEAERELYGNWQQIHDRYDQLMAAKKEPEALDTLAGLKDGITRFFDEVMVMVDEPDVRANRLALLASIHLDVMKFADFRKIVR